MGLFFLRAGLVLLALSISLSLGMPQAQVSKQVYLSPIVGSGTMADPFHPHCTSPYLDLRRDRSITTGPGAMALCAEDALPAQPGVVSLTTALNVTLTAPQKAALQTILGVTITASDLPSVIGELLVLHGRTDGTRWRPLRAGRDGKYHIYLGGVEVWQQTAAIYPYIEDGGKVADVIDTVKVVAAFTEHMILDPILAWAASISENFNCSDTTTSPFTCQHTWTRFVGSNSGIASNRLALTGNGLSIWRADTTLDTDDHEAEATLAAFSLNGAGYVACGPIVRKAYNATQTYYLFTAVTSAAPKFQLFFVNAGSYNLLAEYTLDPVANDVLKTRADASSISGFVNAGLAAGPVTDTGVDTNTYAGLELDESTTPNSTCELDGFAANDMTTADEMPARRIR